MSLLGRFGYLMGMSLLLLSCGPGADAPPPTPTSQLPSTPTAQTPLPTPAATVIPRLTATRILDPAPASNPTPTRHTKTTVIKVEFGTYEVEEEVRADIGTLPGVTGVIVTQLEVIVTYDPEAIDLKEIIRVLERHLEVYILEVEES